MEFQKNLNFIGTTSDNKDLPMFVPKKWIEVYDQSEGNYNVNKEIRIKTSMLRSDLCDFSDAYIVVKGNITVTKKAFTADDIDAPNNTVANATATNIANNNAFGDKKLVFKKNAPFINCISKINGVKIDNAEDLDVVMPLYNLLKYSKKYRKATGSLWHYYRDKPSSTIGACEIVYFDSFGVENIPEEIKKFIGNRNIKANIYHVQANNSIMCGYFCIGFIDFMLAGKTLTDYTNLFSPYDFNKNDSIIISYFKYA